MNFKVEKSEQEKGEVVLTITIPFQEQKKNLEKAARNLTKARPIKGFRPGKATLDVVVKTYGGEAVLNEAIQSLVGDSLFDAIEKEKLKSIGQPKIDIVKQAYENDFVYKATVSLMPSVKVGDYNKVKSKPVKVELTDKEVDEAIDGLVKMRATEALVDREAKIGDLVELDFDTTVDKVAIEGGSAKKYKLVLGDKQMIPGFEEELVGLKAGDKKVFKLKFPKEYKKDLAGKEAEFSVSIKSVFERIMPKLDDEFAKGFGQENMAGLKSVIKNNIKQEKETEELRRQEVDILKQLVDLSDFGELPKLLIDNELHRMKHELEEDLSRNNLNYEQYLENLGKTHEELQKEMTPQADIRVRTALMIKQIAEDEKISASDDEIKQEMEKIKSQYSSNPEVAKTLESREYSEYLSTILTNQKVVSWLKDKILPKKDKTKDKAENSDKKEVEK